MYVEVSSKKLKTVKDLIKYLKTIPENTKIKDDHGDKLTATYWDTLEDKDSEYEIELKSYLSIESID
jgi:hypothetical protein